LRLTAYTSSRFRHESPVDTSSLNRMYSLSDFAIYLRRSVLVTYSNVQNFDESFWTDAFTRKSSTTTTIIRRFNRINGRCTASRQSIKRRGLSDSINYESRRTTGGCRVAIGFSFGIYCACECVATDRQSWRLRPRITVTYSRYIKVYWTSDIFHEFSYYCYYYNFNSKPLFISYITIIWLRITRTRVSICILCW